MRVVGLIVRWLALAKYRERRGGLLAHGAECFPAQASGAVLAVHFAGDRQHPVMILPVDGYFFSAVGTRSFADLRLVGSEGLRRDHALWGDPVLFSEAAKAG